MSSLGSFQKRIGGLIRRGLPVRQVAQAQAPVQSQGPMPGQVPPEAMEAMFQAFMQMMFQGDMPQGQAQGILPGDLPHRGQPGMAGGPPAPQGMMVPFGMPQGYQGAPLAAGTGGFGMMEPGPEEIEGKKSKGKKEF